MHRIIAAVLAATACAQQAPAATIAPAAPADPLTLAEALDLADATVPGLEAAAAGVRAAEARRRVAALRPNPFVSVVAETDLGASSYPGGLTQAESTAAVALPLELGGKRAARIGVADAQAVQARLGAAVSRADLALRVTRAFIDAVAAGRRQAVAGEQLGIADEGVRIARVRVRAGKASPIEEQRAELARVNAANAADRAARAAALARGSLGRLVGRPIGAVEAPWFDAAEGAERGVAGAPPGTLALAVADADVATAAAQVRLAHSQRVPDVTLSAGTRRIEATDDVVAAFGVSIPLPVFNNGRAAMAVARAQRDQAQALGRMARLDAEQAIAAAQTDLVDARETARTATGPALGAAREAARIARIGYREGKFGQPDLLDAESVLAATRTAAIDALAAYHDARARLARLAAPVPIITEGRP